ncbi:MAG TPA: hypothetical protein DCM05_17315 [Elusimicrobia bacterium]|nr:hypothetical protein [Elusimicrobiota bacterium]
MALAPAAACLAVAAARAFALVAERAFSSGPASGLSIGGWFLLGFAGYGLLYLADLARLRPAYVFAHELTHALAAWMLGGKVHGIKVGLESGHVDLSHSNPFIALAPYWLPLYALAAVLLYRAALWAGTPLAREAFLLAMGASLSFHFFHTAESLWAARQGDLEDTGAVLGIVLILLLNGVLLLAVLKCLFPRTVPFAQSVKLAAVWTGAFWGGAWEMVRHGLKAVGA